MKKKNLLIVCSDITDLKKIDKTNLSNYEKVILASDDIKVHKIGENLEYVKETIFLQKPIPYTRVSQTAINMIKKINFYLEFVAKKKIFNKKDLFWNYHVEGGYTTQKLQDMLLSIECASLILDKYKISDLIINGYNNSIQIEFLKKLALKRGCKVLFNYRRKIDKSKIKSFARPVYYFFRSIICKIKATKPNILNKKKLILFQIHGTSFKHIENNLFPQKMLLNRGFNTLNIIWGSAKTAKEINLKGYNAISIDFYLKFKDILISLLKVLSLFLKLKSLKKFFYKKMIFTYKGIDLRNEIFKSIKQYLYTDGPENYRYRVAAQRFSREYSKYIVAIKYSAAKYLTQSTILSEILRDRYLKFDYNVGLYFCNDYNYYNSKLYLNFLNHNFIRFVCNKIEKKNLIKNESVTQDTVIIYGSGRWQKHFDNIGSLSKVQSKKNLGIRKNYKIFLLLDFQEPRPGYISVEELLILLNTLTKLVKNRPTFALLIKPYPKMDLDIIYRSIPEKYENIYLLTKNSVPDDALNIADLIFTKFSSLGLEGMIYDTQVVSYLPDKEKTFKVFGNAAQYLHTKKELNFFFDKIILSEKKYIKWKNSFKQKRKKFILKYYPKFKKNSGEIIAETLERKLLIS